MPKKPAPAQRSHPTRDTDPSTSLHNDSHVDMGSGQGSGKDLAVSNTPSPWLVALSLFRHHGRPNHHHTEPLVRGAEAMPGQRGLLSTRTIARAREEDLGLMASGLRSTWPRILLEGAPWTRQCRAPLTTHMFLGRGTTA